MRGIGPGASDDFDDGEHDVDGHADTGRDQAFFNGEHKSYPPVQSVKGAYGDMIIMGTSREKCLNCLGFCRAHVPIISWGPAVAIASITNEWHRTASQPEPAFSEDY